MLHPKVCHGHPGRVLRHWQNHAQEEPSLCSRPGLEHGTLGVMGHWQGRMGLLLCEVALRYVARVSPSLFVVPYPTAWAKAHPTLPTTQHTPGGMLKYS